jgi:CRISPR system Cascade subunit CasC
MLVETGRRQPRSLAGAFHKAVPLASNDLLGAALTALSNKMRELDSAYGVQEARATLCTAPAALPGVAVTGNLDKIAAWAAAAVRREAA